MQLLSKNEHEILITLIYTASMQAKHDKDSRKV